MQQRRLRPGDVLDDYCPRERRITDHAIVAMIDDTIKQTRCVVCDAEHEYKHGKIPAQRRKKTESALFTQVLDGLQAPLRVAPELMSDTDPPPPSDAAGDSLLAEPAGDDGREPLAIRVAGPEGASQDGADELVPLRDEGPVRRSLIRATLPRPEGQPAPTRTLPNFTIRQPTNGRGNRPVGRRRGPQPQHGVQGPMRFGRGSHGQGQRGHGTGGGRPGGPRRGGKKR